MTNSETVIINQSVAILIDGNNIEMSLHSLMNDKMAMINFDALIPKLLITEGLIALYILEKGKAFLPNWLIVCMSIIMAL